MGLVHYEPQIEDDFSAEVIRLARERSDEINDWFVAQKWIDEVSDDEVTPLWLRKRCLTLVLDELEERGIKLSIEPTELFCEPQLIYCVLMLLTKFSDENLKKLFKEHPACMEVAKTDMGPDVMEAIIGWCDKYLPLDDGWTLVHNTWEEFPGVFVTDNAEFMQHVQKIIDVVDRLGEPDISYFCDEELLFKFISLMTKRIGFIRMLCDAWINRAEVGYPRESRASMIDSYLRVFEKELTSKKAFCSFASEFEQLDVTDTHAVISFFDKIRAPYLKRWKHTLDHYCGDESIDCPDSMLTIIVATLIADCQTPLALESSIHLKLEEYTDRLGLAAIGELKAAFKEIMTNMVNQLEVNYAAE